MPAKISDIIVLVLVVVLDLWTPDGAWSVKEVENENDDEDDWEGTYIALSTYVPPGRCAGGN